ncbi:phage tail protein [Paracoccus stylophorae]|uniref:Phage tail protein n=1 Tax=Paracoccus stylophorae TaxID=659350 RepID=A0ABY7STU0_9RHOB|nr:phage tail protein [Paracoccus stylophorae]WCR09576.1 phage tail protein [Paracoccus stylophorae]
MPAPTFTPPMRPSAGTQITPEVNLRKAPFGDGYGQASPSGLNHIRRIVRLEWAYLSLDEAQQIDTFLTGRGGYRAFTYTLNGEAQPRRWTCAEWHIEDGHPARVTATFREYFGPEV